MTRRLIFEARERFLELALADRLHLLADGDDRRDDLEALEPAPEALHLLLDDRLPAHRLALALVDVTGDGDREVVEVVEVDVVEVVDRGIEVARHGEVDEEHRPLLAGAQHLLDERRRDEVVGRAGGADHDVGELQVFRDAIEGYRDALELARQRNRALERAGGDHHAADALGLQMARGELAHRPGADQHRGLVVELLEDRPREVDGRRRDRHGFAGNARLRAHALRDGERAVEDSMQHGSGRAGERRLLVMVLHLAEDLRLADDHRVEARGDAEQMPHALASGVRVEMRRELRVRHVALGGEELADPRLETARAGVLGDARDDLDAVARRDDRRLVHAVETGETRERRLQVDLRERETLPHCDRRGAVAQADDEDVACHVSRSCRRAYRGRRRCRRRTRPTPPRSR